MVYMTMVLVKLEMTESRAVWGSASEPTPQRLGAAGSRQTRRAVMSRYSQPMTPSSMNRSPSAARSASSASTFAGIVGDEAVDRDGRAVVGLEEVAELRPGGETVDPQRLLMGHQIGHPIAEQARGRDRPDPTAAPATLRAEAAVRTASWWRTAAR